MKTIFILKLTQHGEVGYYDGSTNWTGILPDAKNFSTYQEAESFLKDMMDQHGWGGFVQIEKYFTPTTKG